MLSGPIRTVRGPLVSAKVSRCYANVMDLLMKLMIAVIAVLLLVLGFYYLHPDIDRVTEKYWAYRIDRTATNEEMGAAERRDSLIVLSLNFRQEGHTTLALDALFKADSVQPGAPLVQGLKGLYFLERSEKRDAIEAWKAGAGLAPDDPNLSYLAGLDTAELQYVDLHMLEEFFVDSVLNSRLDVPVYHAADYDLFKETEKKIRIESSVNSTFIVTSGLAILAIALATWKIRKARRLRRLDTAVSGISKPVSYMLVISSVLKIGQVLAAGFNYFYLGTDISEFVSNYVFTPEHLWDLFTQNILFAGIFFVIVVTEIVRRLVSRGQ